LTVVQAIARLQKLLDKHETVMLADPMDRMAVLRLVENARSCPDTPVLLEMAREIGKESRDSQILHLVSLSESLATVVEHQSNEIRRLRKLLGEIP
jgi:hypothetical protein